MSNLQARIDELVAIAKAEHPAIPEWYITLSVEKYIRDEEYELFKDEIDELIRQAAVENTEENTSTISKETEQECPS